MKIQRKISATTIVEVEGQNLAECYDQCAALEEIYGVGPCGACKSTHIQFRVRDVGGIKHREAYCQDCGAALAFGVRKVGGALFPRRKDAQGKWLANGGWSKYVPSTNGGDTTPTTTQLPEDF